MLRTSVELAELLRVFEAPEREDFERSLEAVRRRREFRLVEGTKP
jgi:hypothetical protein